jgi:hypothetical protein
MNRYIALASACMALFATATVRSEEGNAARVVTWQPHAGAEHAFENGYRRHLAWHREHRDPWTWLGWSITSGDRAGYFVDGTFFHAWADFDMPIAPAEDAADNKVNVHPYATLRSNGTYETIAQSPGRDASALTLPFITFAHIELTPGRAAEFEARAIGALRRGKASAVLLRPVRGAAEYLLMLPARDQSQLATHTEVTTALVSEIETHAKNPIVKRIRTESARYRADMSYLPE